MNGMHKTYIPSSTVSSGMVRQTGQDGRLCLGDGRPNPNMKRHGCLPGAPKYSWRPAPRPLRPCPGKRGPHVRPLQTLGAPASTSKS
jgi:hypothetical protein